MFHSIDISTTGLLAQRERITAIAANIANIHSTRDADGNYAPYRRRLVQFMSRELPGGGTGVDYRIEIDRESPLRRVYDPGHPDADSTGHVYLPNVRLADEMINSVEASRAYQANLTTMRIAQTMEDQAMQILT